MSSEIIYEQLLGFWFGTNLDEPDSVAERSRTWFGGDEAFDRTLESSFGHLPAEADAQLLREWLSGDRSLLALIITLDQLPRNFYRGNPRAFAYDKPAQELTAQALDQGVDQRLHPLEALFIYMPLEHAEDLQQQQLCVELFDALCRRAPANLRHQFIEFHDYALRHRDVIERFGRFPHRNTILNRDSTDEERTYLATGGDQF